MLLRLLSGSALLLLPYLSLGQAPINLPSESFKQQLRNKYLHNDTAQAIVNLYSKRQVGGASWMVGGALAAARLATLGGREVSSGPGYTVYQEAPSTGAVLLASLPFLGYGLSKMLHYSNAHLEQQLTAYAAGQPLPRSVRRKLKPRFFDQAIINYKTIPVTPVR